MSEKAPKIENKAAKAYQVWQLGAAAVTGVLALAATSPEVAIFWGAATAINVAQAGLAEVFKRRKSPNPAPA